MPAKEEISMGTYTVECYKYIPSGPATLKQGVKGMKTPKGAVAGGYGTFVMRGDPPQVNVYFDGGKQFVDVYPFIKENIGAAGCSRVTKKLCAQICEPMIGMQFEQPEELAAPILHEMLKR